VLAGIGAAMLLWFAAAAAALGALVFWLCFPGLTGSQFCCSPSSSGCSLSIGNFGTALPDRCDVADLWLAGVLQGNKCNS
jgi:hypothetical protein